jgi:DNA-binding NtrC family response regulator
MGTILLCTRGEDLIRELGPLLQVEHQVAVVPQMADAVQELLLRRFDAVVLDLDEELVCRLEALPILGRLNPRVPILVVSTQPTLEGEAAIRAAGIFCLLVRPLARGELEKHLAAALRWRAAEANVPPSARHANPAGSIAG